MVTESNAEETLRTATIFAVRVDLHHGGTGWANFYNRRPFLGSDTHLQTQPFMMTQEDAESINKYVEKFGASTIYRLTPI